MRGKAKAPIRDIAPDYKFQSVPLAKFINYIMERGKKTVAQKIVYGAFDIITEKKLDPLATFEAAIKFVAPALEVRSKRVGGANYQIPMPVRAERRQALAYRWIIEAARGRKGKPMHEKLAYELMDAAKEEGAAVKKRQDVHRMAEANRAFAHFAR